MAEDQGTAWARIATGNHAGETWHLPRRERTAYENVVASPHPQEKTIVVRLDDSSITTAPVIKNNYFPATSIFISAERGKTDIQLSQRVSPMGTFTVSKSHSKAIPLPRRATISGSGPQYGIHRQGQVQPTQYGRRFRSSSVQIENLSFAAGVTRFQRVEDGAWDPERKKILFRHHREVNRKLPSVAAALRRIERPQRGGTIEILLKEDEGQDVDNVTIDHRGRIFVDEDPGGNDRVAKIWMYDISSGDLPRSAHRSEAFRTEHS